MPWYFLPDSSAAIDDDIEEDAVDRTDDADDTWLDVELACSFSLSSCARRCSSCQLAISLRTACQLARSYRPVHHLVVPTIRDQ